jgi:hypothetical protein
MIIRCVLMRPLVFLKLLTRRLPCGRIGAWDFITFVGKCKDFYSERVCMDERGADLPDHYGSYIPG